MTDTVLVYKVKNILKGYLGECFHLEHIELDTKTFFEGINAGSYALIRSTREQIQYNLFPKDTIEKARKFKQLGMTVFVVNTARYKSILKVYEKTV